MRENKFESVVYQWAEFFVRVIPSTLGVRIRKHFYNFILNDFGEVWVKRGVTIRAPYNLKMGNRDSIGEYSWLDATGGLEIGDDVIIAPFCLIYSSNHNFKDAQKK